MFHNSLKNLFYMMLCTLLLGLVSAAPAQADDDEAIAKEITLILKASRAVVVQNKLIIKDPRGAGISAAKFMEMAKDNYAKAAGKPYAQGAGAMGDAQGKLMAAIHDVVDNVVSGKDKDLDPQGRFLPAIFARKAAARFGETSGGKMYLKLTTRDAYLVNASNKADAWEKGVIDGKFLGAGWEKGKTFSEVADHGGKKAFRLILPEYFSAPCMGCHGGEEGAKIHAGKVAGKDGELGGAISVAIYK